MIPITEATRTALKQPVKQVRAKINWQTSESDSYEITSEDRVISVKKEAEGYFLGSTLRKITIVVTGTDLSLLDQKIRATIQVKTGANAWGDIKWGSFTIKEETVDQAKGTSTFVGYGGIADLQDTEYQAGQLTFPTTVAGLITQIAAKFSLAVNPDLKILPAEYQRVESLTTTGTQFINTGFKPTPLTKTRMEWEFTSTTVQQRVFAVEQAGTGLIYQMYANGAYAMGVAYQDNTGQWTNANTPITVNTKMIYELDGKNKRATGYNADGVQIGTRSLASYTATQTAAYPLYLMAESRSGGTSSSNRSTGVFYSCRIWDNDIPVRDFVPCIRKSDSVAGLYDLVTGTFYENAGTGTFTPGAIVHSLPNADVEINEDLWAKISGTTYRDILEQAAGATGTLAVISGGDDNIDFYNPPIAEASETLTEANLISSTVGESWGKVSAVVLSRQPQNDNIEAVDTTTTQMPGGKNLVPFTSTLTFPIERQGTTTTMLEDGSMQITGVPSANYVVPSGSVNITDWLEDGAIYAMSQTQSSGNFYIQVNNRIISTGGTQYRGLTGGILRAFQVDKALYDRYTVQFQTGTTTGWGTDSRTIAQKFQLEKVNPTKQLWVPKATFPMTVGGGVTVTLEDDGSITLNGTATSTFHIIYNTNFDFSKVASQWVQLSAQTTGTGNIANLGLKYNGTSSDIIVLSNLSNIAQGATNKTLAASYNGTKTLDIYRSVSSGSSYTYENFNIKVQLLKADAVTPFEFFKPNGRVDLVIANNEILDKQRETTITPILNAVKGWEYRNAQIKTEGHGYHEIGDRLDITIAGETHKTIVTKSTILINGGIQETLTSTTPEQVPINYAKTGGITKTIFNTELAVDKQEQRIDAIVSRQDTTDAEVAAQFTQVTQNLTEIVSTVQSSGGGNLIRNSVGFGKEADGHLTVWAYGTGATTTNVKSQSSPASLNAGAVSGHEIMMTGASIISQDIALTPGETYTLALRAKKVATGAITIRVGNSSNNATITLANGTAYNWERQSVEFTPALGANTVTITVPASASFEITDLLLTSGGGYTWRQASGEIYNTQVSLDQDGVQVRSSVYTGDYTSITPLEFAGYSNASGTMQKVFSLNRDTTEVAKLEARDQIKMAPIKIVPVDNSTWSGWAFVKEQ